MTPTALRIRSVTKSFGVAPTRREVLAGIDLSVAAGEVVVLFGRSGSGKTTLLTVAAGFDVADSGTVEVDRTAGPDVASDWGRVALLPQSLGLLDELTVAENVALPLVLTGASDDGVGAHLERLSIGHLARRLPSEISLGEQQRTALARAAVVRPCVLIADEPVSHQNHELADRAIDVVADLAARGTACLLATHDPAVVRIANRVVELHDGRIEEVAVSDFPR